jgi:putative transposase
LTALRAELPWLADVPRDVLTQLLVELDKAWRRCFKKLARAPRWKRKDCDVLGFCEPHYKSWRLDRNVLHFPKIGPLRTIVHRPIEGTPKTCTIKRDGDQWFTSVVCELEVVTPAPRVEPVIAIDRGVINLIGDSDGEKVKAPRHLRAALRRLAHAQRVVSRRKKGSKNRAKAKLRVARIHRKVRRQRDHVLHELSASYANNHGTVVIERLQIGNMVKANKGLARSILDAGWGRFAVMLKYKLAWNGGQLVEVCAMYSSQTCSRCEVVDPKSRSSQAVFLCTACGYSDHADLNAAKVLKRRANRSVLPVEGSLNQGTLRNRKRLRVARRASESPALIGQG